MKDREILNCVQYTVNLSVKMVSEAGNYFNDNYYGILNQELRTINIYPVLRRSQNETNFLQKDSTKLVRVGKL